MSCVASGSEGSKRVRKDEDCEAGSVRVYSGSAGGEVCAVFECVVIVLLFVCVGVSEECVEGVEGVLGADDAAPMMQWVRLV